MFILIIIITCICNYKVEYKAILLFIKRNICHLNKGNLHISHVNRLAFLFLGAASTDLSAI
jgi:hypothetical protein